MVYELRKGPLALPGVGRGGGPLTPHIMIIDEINRANLPRVFGELLFLLEYRSPRSRRPTGRTRASSCPRTCTSSAR